MGPRVETSKMAVKSVNGSFPSPDELPLTILQVIDWETIGCHRMPWGGTRNVDIHADTNVWYLATVLVQTCSQKQIKQSQHIHFPKIIEITHTACVPSDSLFCQVIDWEIKTGAIGCHGEESRYSC